MTREKKFTPAEAAPLLEYSTYHVQRLCREGLIDHEIRRGGRYFIAESTIKKFWRKVKARR